MREKRNNPIDSLVGARIRLLRKRRKMSQEQLGQAIGVTFQQIQNMRMARIGLALADCIGSPSRSTFRSLNSSTVQRSPAVS
jgi:transcriptional regulator with XRE-family HTH domain